MKEQRNAQKTLTPAIVLEPDCTKSDSLRAISQMRLLPLHIVRVIYGRPHFNSVVIHLVMR